MSQPAKPQSESESHRRVGLEGTLKIVEPWNGWVELGRVGRGLKDHRTMEGTVPAALCGLLMAACCL